MDNNPEPILCVDTGYAYKEQSDQKVDLFACRSSIPIFQLIQHEVKEIFKSNLLEFNRKWTNWNGCATAICQLGPDAAQFY